MRAAHWPGGERGTVLLFPGRTEYIEKYGEVAARLVAHGLHVATIDWRGQGLSERTHRDESVGHVDEFAEYQRDVAALLAFAADLPRPLHLLAHSMGGAIGLRALHEGLPVKAAVFSAPMWGLTMKPHLRPAAWVLSSLSRHLSFDGNYAPGTGPAHLVETAAFELNALTGDRAQWERMQRQYAAHPELALGGPSLAWLNEALKEMKALRAIPAPDVPAMAGVGTREAIVAPYAIHDRMRGWGETRVYEGGQHELMMEVPETRGAFLGAALEMFS